MPHTKSAKKRLKQNEKRRLANKSSLTTTKNQVKRLLKAIEYGNLEDARKQLQVVTKTLYKTASQGVIRKETASRRLSRLTKRVNMLEAGPATK